MAKLVIKEIKRSEGVFERISEEMEEKFGTEQSKMFGMPCLKIRSKAFCGLFGDDMVFKLTGDDHKKALGLEGAKLFDPSGMKRPMKEWVQVPPVHQKKWKEFAVEALKYVA